MKTIYWINEDGTGIPTLHQALRDEIRQSQIKSAQDDGMTLNKTRLT